MDSDCEFNEREFDSHIKHLDERQKIEEYRRDTLNRSYFKALARFSETAFLRNMVANFMEDGTLPPEFKGHPNYINIMDSEYKRNSTKSPYWLVTISVKPGITFPELAKAVEKQVNKKIIKSYFYVYEVRHLPDEKRALFEGLHCHMIIHSHTRPYDFKKTTKNTFKDLCDINNPEIMNFKNIAEDILPDKISYLLGEKKDSKLKGVELTKAFRVRLDIENFYDSNPKLPCRVAKQID